MSLSLYDISVPNYLQILDSTITVLEKGATFAKEGNDDLDQYQAIQLHPDMLPLSFQVISVAHHSLGAINGIKVGVFAPPPSFPGIDYSGLKALLEDARAQLQATTEEEVNSLSGKAMIFKLGDFEIPFTAENFIQSFSMPNFYFHATTTYDILRMKGVPLGKRDFMGAMRTG